MPDIEQAKKKSVDFVRDLCLSADSPWTVVALVLGWREPRLAPQRKSIHHFTHSIACRPDTLSDLTLLPEAFRHMASELPAIVRGDVVALPSERQSAKAKVLDRIRNECLTPLSPWRTAAIVLGWRSPGDDAHHLWHHFTQAVAVKPADRADLLLFPSSLREIAQRMDRLIAGSSADFDVSTARR